MLINALLERELLYSSEGHATGTECYIEYAEPEQQRIELTFLTITEIREEVNSLLIGLQDLMGEDWDYTQPDFDNPNYLEKLRNECQKIISTEGGARKSDIAKKADALKLLLEGFKDNKEWIYPDKNAVRSMNDLKLVFNEAATYARRGSNSAVLKRINYFFNHHLLQRGNVIVDLPGIDAPVEKDAQLTYNKIEDSETSAVICVLKIASEGEITTEETQLLEKIRKNPGIRDRVFFVFNRIDETWYKRELATRLSELMNSEFAEEENRKRVYKTSALLGFYGSQIKHTSKENRFGLDTILKNNNDKPITHQFVYDFNSYCASDKLRNTEFEIVTNNRKEADETYLNILEMYGESLIDQLIDDSGVKEFRECITSYFIEEKHRELFEYLTDDLSVICRHLKEHYEKFSHDLSRQPSKPEAIKAQKFASLKTDLQNIADSFKEDMFKEALKVSEGNQIFKKDFDILKSKMLSKLEELLNGFFLWDAYESARRIHRQYITVPLLSVLGEAFYYLTSQLEDVLAQECENLVASFFERLINQVYKRDYYKKLKRLLGNDVEIAESLNKMKCEITKILKEYAHQECEYYLREDPEFYTDSYSKNFPNSHESNSEVLEDEDEEDEDEDEDEEYVENEDELATSPNLLEINKKVGIYQFREVLQQTFKDYTKESIESVQPVVRQLLQLDFQNKVEKTIQETFYHTFNSILNANLQKLADKKYQEIIRQDELARNHLKREIEKEADKKVKERNDNVQELSKKIKRYNELIKSINSCLKDESSGDKMLLLEVIEEFNQTKEELPENGKFLQGKSVDEHSSTDPIEKSVDGNTSIIMKSESVQDVNLQQKVEKKRINKAGGFNPKASK
ncbi:MAG: dynamin-like GTPase family protein [Richelia sp. SM1_7_0]|nr:dynamin-like GTPase family protein [Richelia sp. SM1_7_0]